MLAIKTSAKKMGISPSGKRRRLGKVGLIKNLIRDYYDTLHTEIREAVTNDVVETLENLKTSNLQPIGLSGFLLTNKGHRTKRI